MLYKSYLDNSEKKICHDSYGSAAIFGLIILSPILICFADNIKGFDYENMPHNAFYFSVVFSCVALSIIASLTAMKVFCSLRDAQYRRYIDEFKRSIRNDAIAIVDKLDGFHYPIPHNGLDMIIMEVSALYYTVADIASQYRLDTYLRTKNKLKKGLYGFHKSSYDRMCCYRKYACLECVKSLDFSDIRKRASEYFYIVNSPSIPCDPFSFSSHDATYSDRQYDKEEAIRCIMTAFTTLLPYQLLHDSFLPFESVTDSMQFPFEYNTRRDIFLKIYDVLFHFCQENILK